MLKNLCLFSERLKGKKKKFLSESDIFSPTRKKKKKVEKKDRKATWQE